MVSQLPTALRAYIDPSVEHDANGLAVGDHNDKGRKRMDANAFLAVSTKAQLAHILRIAGEEGVVVTPRGASSSTAVVALPGGKEGGFLETHDKTALVALRFSGGDFGNKNIALDLEGRTAWVPPGVSQADFRRVVEERSEGRLTTMEYQTDPSAQVVAAKMAGSVDDDGHGVHNNATALDLMYGNGREERVRLTPVDYFGVSSFSRLSEVCGNVVRLFDGRGAPGFLATGVEVPLPLDKPKVRFAFRIAKGSYPEMLEKLARANHLFAKAAARLRETHSELQLTSAEFMDISTVQLVRKLENKKDLAPGEGEGVGLIVYPEFALTGPRASELQNDLGELLSLLSEVLDLDELDRLGELLPPLKGEQVAVMDGLRQDLPEAGRADKRRFKATTDPAVNPLHLGASLELMDDMSGMAEAVLLEDKNAGIYIYGHGQRNGMHGRIATDSKEALAAHEAKNLQMSQRLIGVEKRGPGVARVRGEKPFQGGLSKDVKLLAYGLTPDHVRERKGLIHSFDPQGVLLLSEIETHVGFDQLVRAQGPSALRGSYELGQASFPAK